jgi:hypothetical protein
MQGETKRVMSSKLNSVPRKPPAATLNSEQELEWLLCLASTFQQTTFKRPEIGKAKQQRTPALHIAPPLRRKPIKVRKAS